MKFSINELAGAQLTGIEPESADMLQLAWRRGPDPAAWSFWIYGFIQRRAVAQLLDLEPSCVDEPGEA